MRIKPKSLNLPLFERSWLWLWAVAIVFAVGFGVRTYDRAFGSVFLATAVLVLPVLLLFLMGRGRSGGSNLIGISVAMVYMFAAKNYVLPWLVERFT
jgi:uncharacterized membrane protein YccC